MTRTGYKVNEEFLTNKDAPDQCTRCLEAFNLGDSAYKWIGGEFLCECCDEDRREKMYPDY